MTPEKALDLVGRYSRLTRQIKDCKKRIGESMALCNGISGERLAVDEFGRLIRHRQEDQKGRDRDLHLTQWYTPDMQGDHDEYPVYEEVGEWSKEECPHCYAAHVAIQERKLAKKQLATVKGSMTRAAA